MKKSTISAILLSLSLTDAFLTVHVAPPFCRSMSVPNIKKGIVANQQKQAAIAGEPLEARPSCYVVLSNLQSGTNIGRITRNALAFGASEVIVIGKRDINMHHGDKGAQRRQTFVHFYTIAEAARYLKEERGATILGVEIADGAVPVHLDPFSRSTAFMFGNEALGLSVSRAPFPAELPPSSSAPASPGAAARGVRRLHLHRAVRRRRHGLHQRRLRQRRRPPPLRRLGRPAGEPPRLRQVRGRARRRRPLHRRRPTGRPRPAAEEVAGVQRARLRRHGGVRARISAPPPPGAAVGAGLAGSAVPAGGFWIRCQRRAPPARAHTRVQGRRQPCSGLLQGVYKLQGPCTDTVYGP